MNQAPRAVDTRVAGFSPTVRVGFGLAESVLGAGMLISPSVIAGVAGRHAPLAWLVHLLGGACFSCLIGVLAYTRTGNGSVADVTGAVLGEWARRTILVSYLVGFTVGQVAIALAAGALVATSVGESTAGSTAAALLLTCTVAAMSGLPFSARARSWRFGLTAIAAFVLASQPQLATASGLLPGREMNNLPLGIFLLFFAGVGWETMARSAPALDSPRAVVRAVALGALLIAGCYLLLALLIARDDSSGPAAGWWLHCAGLVMAVILGSYCVTNIRSAAGFLTLLGGPSARPAAGVVGLSCLSLLTVAVMAGSTVSVLLAGPGLAVWLVYCLAMLAVSRVTGTWYGVGALGVLGALVSLLVAIILR